MKLERSRKLQGLLTSRNRKLKLLPVSCCAEHGGSEQNTQHIPGTWRRTDVHLENPEYHTRWYFKYFLGKVHQNYIGTDLEKNPFFLSVVLSDQNNQRVPQYRAILWRKTGTQKICLSYCPTKTLSVKSILSAMNLDRFEKSPREILNPEIQKDLLVLEEQEGSVNFKFGVLYAKDGQLTDDEMFSNEAGSESFQKLLNLLGDTITLKSWIGYRGGLDTKKAGSESFQKLLNLLGDTITLKSWIGYRGGLDTKKELGQHTWKHLSPLKFLSVRDLEDANTQHIPGTWRRTDVHLENPEYHTRWYFKYFLGKVHQNYIGTDLEKNPFFLSVVLSDQNNQRVPQYRAILWRKTGTQKICLSYCPTKTVSVKSILSAMNLDRFEKSPREILNPEIQKGTQKICLSYCPTKTVSVKSILSAMNLDRFEKSPREILNPEIQKGTQKICLSYCPTKTVSVKSILSAMNLDRFEKSPREILNPEIQKDLLVLEEQEGSVNFKFGVLYAKDGQLTDDEMFSNEAGSESFQKLLNLLGDTITLKSWIGYRGGLDTKNQLQNKDLLSIPIRAKPLIILEFIITNAKIPKVHKTLIIKLPKV